MPIYEYQCQNELCAYRSEVRVSYEEREETIECLHCGAVSALAVARTADPRFKGKGFHTTDYKKQ